MRSFTLFSVLAVSLGMYAMTSDAQLIAAGIIIAAKAIALGFIKGAIVGCGVSGCFNRGGGRGGSSYGGGSSRPVYGQPAQSSGYGVQQSSGYGAQQSSGYGAQQSSGYGQQSSAYGQPAQSSAYGRRRRDVDNGVVNMFDLLVATSNNDADDCVKKMVCLANAKPVDKLTEDEAVIVKTFGVDEGASLDVSMPSVEFDVAALIGQRVGAKQCEMIYARCNASDRNLVDQLQGA